MTFFSVVELIRAGYGSYASGNVPSMLPAVPDLVIYHQGRNLQAYHLSQCLIPQADHLSQFLIPQADHLYQCLIPQAEGASFWALS